MTDFHFNVATLLFSNIVRKSIAYQKEFHSYYLDTDWVKIKGEN